MAAKINPASINNGLNLSNTPTLVNSQNAFTFPLPPGKRPLSYDNDPNYFMALEQVKRQRMDYYKALFYVCFVETVLSVNLSLPFVITYSFFNFPRSFQIIFGFKFYPFCQ